jgi:hypothetical protein
MKLVMGAPLGGLSVCDYLTYVRLFVTFSPVTFTEHARPALASDFV